MKLRATIAALSLVVIVSMIGYLFYQNEIQYWIPTPVPKDYEEVAMGSVVSTDLYREGEKKFIHFFNPKCPCSKFNFTTYKNLIKKYGDEFQCFAVVQETTEGVKEEDVAYLRKLGVKLVADKDKTLAKRLGVYSTPQIVLLDEQNELYYRGNYNLARYCTNPNSDYSKMAIETFLIDLPLDVPSTAFTAYGCSLDRKTNH